MYNGLTFEFYRMERLDGLSVALLLANALHTNVPLSLAVFKFNEFYFIN